ncbi:MAG TPA: response regulator FixJ [Rhizomicrobium sp.]|jgi:two-component system response regulator FixJ|nr:response regulator FixJ [Rhizomicrobium sp.]
MTTSEPVIFIVDDDESVRDSLSGLLEASGFRTEVFPSAKAFLAAGALAKTGCLIADIRMPDMDGLELQTELKRQGSALPVIVMTGHGDVPLAVRAMKAGAIDFLEKPYDAAGLLQSVRYALQSPQGAAPTPGGPSAEVRDKLQTLTPREREVLDLVVAGTLNKVIAHKLSISPRTVEIHRARVMQKMGARNLPELIRMFVAVRT